MASSPRARGQTPLHCAAANDHDFTVERLLAAGADVNAVDNEGRGLGAERVSTWILHKFVAFFLQNIIISGGLRICLNSLKLWEFSTLRIQFGPSPRQLPRHDTLSVGREQGSRDGVGLVESCALKLQLEGCSMVFILFIWGGFLLSCGYDYLLENWRIGESIFEYFAFVNVKSLRIRIVMESSCHMLSQNVIST